LAEDMLTPRPALRISENTFLLNIYLPFPIVFSISLGTLTKIHDRKKEGLLNEIAHIIMNISTFVYRFLRAFRE